MWKYLLGAAMAVIVSLSGCAAPVKVVTVPTGEGEKVIEMQARSFEFDPNIIQARQGDRLLLVITNRAGMTHNITISKPGGAMLLSQDLPAGETVRFEVMATERGTYEFYCDKPMHPGLGMKGRLEVR